MATAPGHILILLFSFWIKFLLRWIFYMARLPVAHPSRWSNDLTDWEIWIKVWKKSKVTKADLDQHQLTSRVLDRLVTAPRNLALLRKVEQCQKCLLTLVTSESLQMINGKITRIEFWQRDNETSNFICLNFLKKKFADKSFFDTVMVIMRNIMLWHRQGYGHNQD